VGFSGSAAVYLRPVDWFALGVTYHGPTRMVLADGNVDFDVPNRFAELFPDQHADTVIVLPDMIWMGIRFWPLPELSIELDVVQVQWSHYDALVFEFEEGIGDPPADEEVLRTDWHDSPEVRFGVAWDTPLPGLTTFAGFMYETLVIPKHRIDPTLPDNERFDTSFGLAYTRWGVTLTGS